MRTKFTNLWERLLERMWKTLAASVESRLDARTGVDQVGLNGCGERLSGHAVGGSDEGLQ